jgi:hypothetical protein
MGVFPNAHKKGVSYPQRLSDKEKKYVAARVAGKSRIDSVYDSYTPKDRNNAKAVANIVERRPKIQNEIQRQLIKAGVNPQKIGQYWNDVLNGDFKADPLTGKGIKATHKEYLGVLRDVTKIFSPDQPKVSLKAKVDLNELGYTDLDIRHKKTKKVLDSLIQEGEIVSPS